MGTSGSKKLFFVKDIGTSSFLIYAKKKYILIYNTMVAPILDANERYNQLVVGLDNHVMEPIIAFTREWDNTPIEEQIQILEIWCEPEPFRLTQTHTININNVPQAEEYAFTWGELDHVNDLGVIGRQNAVQPSLIESHRNLRARLNRAHRYLAEAQVAAGGGNVVSPELAEARADAAAAAEAAAGQVGGKYKRKKTKKKRKKTRKATKKKKKKKKKKTRRATKKRR
jgi:hypothetical protein